MSKTTFVFITVNNELNIYNIRLMDKYFRVLNKFRTPFYQRLRQYLTHEELKALEAILHDNSYLRDKRKKIKDDHPCIIRFAKRDKVTKIVLSRDSIINAHNFRVTPFNRYMPNL